MSDSEWVSDPTFKIDDEWESDPTFKKEKTTAFDAFHKNASDAATLGYAPQIRAGVIDPIVEKVGNFFTGNDVDMGNYVDNRDAYRREIETSKKEHPDAALAGTVTGTLATALAPGMNAAKGATAGARILNAARTGAVMGGVMNPGDTEGEVNLLQLPDRIENAGKGMVTGAVLQGLGEGAVKGVKALGQGFRSGAEKLAENATGATGKQAEKFRDGAGRELLDRGLVKFGDNAESVANRVSGAVDDANAQIDGALKALDAKGVTASADNVVIELQKKITDLSKDPSQAGTVRKLQGIVDDIINTGQSHVPLSAAEQTKRGFRKAAGNWMDPETGQAGKQAYLGYMNEVEGAANAADPALAKMFEQGKKDYGLLAPIEEAAKRRAAVQNQHQFGGLLDLAAGAYGLSDPDSFSGKAALGFAARRFVAPRVASSAAVIADKVSKMLLQTPRFQKLATENPKAFSAMVSNFAGRMESSGGQAMPRAADKDNGTTSLLDRYNSDPNSVNGLKNESLKEQLQKLKEKQRLETKIPVEQAQSEFVAGN